MKIWTQHPRHHSGRVRARLNLEQLETRLVPYSVSGGSWLHPNLITISFEPDGTDLGGVSSNLFAKLNAHTGWTTATWQNQFLKAAQQWAAQTNVNFAVVSDNGTGIGGGLFQQGDPGMGDIRIGGYDFNDPTTIAGAIYPQPINNFSIAGDIDFNTGVPWNIGTTFDIYSVAMHEFGHALGMGESSSGGSVMRPDYSPHSGLSADDITGIHTIYGTRAYDSYYGAATPNNSFTNAADISSSINLVTLAAVVSPLDITTTSENEYFKFTVPSGSQTSFNVTVQSSGLSLLAPSMTIYNSSQTQIGTVSGLGHYGTTLSYNVTGASAGQVYYVKIKGADTTAFGTGAYGLTLNFGILPNPTVPAPVTLTPDGVPLHSGGGDPERSAGNDDNNSVPSQSPLPAATLVNASNQTYAGAGQQLTFTTVSPVAVQTILALPSVQASVSSAIGSGAGETIAQPVPDVLDQPIPEMALPDAPLTPANDKANLLATPADALSWRDAASACFAADSDAQLPAQRRDETSSANVQSESALDHASAAACLVIMLGSYWHNPAEKSSQSKRRARELRRL